MFDSSRCAAGQAVQPARVELLLAEAVVEPDPGARRDHPRAVPRRDRHRSTPRRRRRSAETCAVEPDSSTCRWSASTSARNAARVPLEVVGGVQHVEPVAEHRALHPHQVLDVVVGPVRRAAARRAAAASPPRTTPPTDGGGVVASVQSPTRVVRDGRTTGRYAARSSGPSSPPRAEHVLADPAGPARRCASTPGPSAAISSSDSARSGTTTSPVVISPSLVVDRRVAGRVPAEDVLVHVVEVVARRRAQPEPAAGHVDRRRDDLAPRQPPVARVRLAERRQRPVGRHRPRTDRDRRPRRRTRSPRPRSRRSASRPWPGMSIQPSTVYAAAAGAAAR